METNYKFYKTEYIIMIIFYKWVEYDLMCIDN